MSKSTVLTSVNNGKVNTENVTDVATEAVTDVTSDVVKAEVLNVKEVKALPKMDAESIIDSLVKVEEIGDKAKLFKCLLINTMIKYHGKDGKKKMVERFGYTNDTINSYAMVAEKFLKYEMPYAIEKKDGKDVETMSSTALSAIKNCDGKIKGLKDKDGCNVSFTVMHAIRNLTETEVKELIDDGSITYLTTQKQAQELCKRFAKNTKKTTSNSNTENDDKPIKLSAMKKDSERIAMMIKLMNSLSDGIKSNEDKFNELAEVLEWYKNTAEKAEKQSTKATDTVDTVDTVEEYGLDNISDIQ